MNFENIKLRYDAEAYFEGAEKYPDGGLIKAMVQDGREGFEAMCFALALMSRRARVYAEYIGEPLPEELDEKKLRVMMRPRDIGIAREMAMAAFIAGIKSDDDDPDDEVDLVLEELNEGKTAGGD